ncbi:hypothetical protein OSTOST_15028, partial [Ostertagia ostertagi]
MESSDSELDPDLLEPPTKRIRRFTDHSANDRSEEEEVRSRLDCKKRKKDIEANNRMERRVGRFKAVFWEVFLGNTVDRGLDIRLQTTSHGDDDDHIGGGHRLRSDSSVCSPTSRLKSRVIDEDSVMRRRTETKQLADFQANVTCDEPNHDGFNDVNRDPLTESMLVNYDVLNGNCPEY